jgi:Asp-tRNA(Asn)/Glu-tRNA(Gln) amidotransferase A subunit family amidase
MTGAVVSVSTDPFGPFVSFFTRTATRDGPLRGLTLAVVAGVPALSMPCPNPQGAFVSLQLLAPQGHDTRVIAIVQRLSLLLSAK